MTDDPQLQEKFLPHLYPLGPLCGNGNGTGLLGRTAGGNETPVNGSLADLYRKDGAFSVPGNGRSTLRPSSSWVSDFLKDLLGWAWIGTRTAGSR